MAKQTRRDPLDLYKLPEVQKETLYLFQYYCDVKGQDPLSYVEVQAWINLTGTQLTPGEVDTLFMLDAVFYEDR